MRLALLVEDLDYFSQKVLGRGVERRDLANRYFRLLVKSRSTGTASEYICMYEYKYEHEHEHYQLGRQYSSTVETHRGARTLPSFPCVGQ